MEDGPYPSVFLSMAVGAKNDTLLDLIHDPLYAPQLILDHRYLYDLIVTIDVMKVKTDRVCLATMHAYTRSLIGYYKISDGLPVSFVAGGSLLQVLISVK